MTTEDFWALIATIDVSALDNGDEEGAVFPLQSALTGKQESELEAFEEHLSRFLYNLDGEVFANHAGESGDSDDGFLYARCYVVAKGKTYFESVVAAPEKMPNSIDKWCEALLYSHRHAWAETTGRDISEWAFDASVSYESGSNPDLWPN